MIRWGTTPHTILNDQKRKISSTYGVGSAAPANSKKFGFSERFILGYNSRGTLKSLREKGYFPIKRGSLW